MTEVIECGPVEFGPEDQSFSLDDVDQAVAAALAKVELIQTRRSFALDQASTLAIRRADMTPEEVARAAATFDRFLEHGTVADGKPEPV